MMLDLQALRGLRDGWHDGAGLAPPVGAVDQFEQALEAPVRDGRLRVPCVFPTFEGAIRAEWTAGRHKVSAEFDYRSGELYLHAAAGLDDEEASARVGDVEALVVFVQRFEGRGPRNVSTREVLLEQLPVLDRLAQYRRAPADTDACRAGDGSCDGSCE